MSEGLDSAVTWVLRDPASAGHLRYTVVKTLMDLGLEQLKDVSCGELMLDAYRGWAEDKKDWR